MKLLIKFTVPLVRMEGSGWPNGGGWRPDGTGAFIPFEVIDYVEHIGVDTLALLPPTRLKFDDDAYVILWESREKTITVCVHVTLVDTLTMKKS